MKLITQVKLPSYPFRVDHHSPCLMIGSCFTENIGRLLERSMFPIAINPFGVSYNPVSVHRQLEALMDKQEYGIADLDQHDGLWFSFDHYTGFSSPDREACLKGINASFKDSKKLLQKAKLLVITWGTAWVYSQRETEKVVCNCHKIPADQFIRSRLSVKEIIRYYNELLPRLFKLNPELKVLLSVSPVRHWKDGAHGNQLSKASLLLATEALVKQFPDQVFYFPSYEMVMDELRDYRFYAEDMVHLNETATRYIWEKFSEALVSEESLKIIKDLEPLIRMKEHRSSGREGEAHLATLQKLEEKEKKLQGLYPFLDWNK